MSNKEHFEETVIRREEVKIEARDRSLRNYVIGAIFTAFLSILTSVGSAMFLNTRVQTLELDVDGKMTKFIQATHDAGLATGYEQGAKDQHEQDRHDAATDSALRGRSGPKGQRGERGPVGDKAVTPSKPPFDILHPSTW